MGLNAAEKMVVVFFVMLASLWAVCLAELKVV
jgi:hypothetical protein